MKSANPPRLARWMLERFGTASRLRSLVGDLAEEYANGRSRAWYWRQAFGVLALDATRTLRTHSLSFLVAVITGCALTSAWYLANSWAFVPVYKDLWYVSQHPWTLQALWRFAGLLGNIASIVALCSVSAWVVTRIHRAHQRAVLVTFVAALTLQRIPWITRLVVDFIGNSRFGTSLAAEILGQLQRGTFILVIGLWTIRAKSFAHMDRRIRAVALLVLSLILLDAVVVGAYRVGAIPRPGLAPYVLVIAQILSLAYLISRLWRAAPPSEPSSAVPASD